MTKFYRMSRTFLSTIWLGLVLASLTWAQARSPHSEAAPTAPVKSPAEDSRQPQASGEAASKPEGKISPRESQELFRSVDEILKFASADSAFPIKGPVKRKLTSRDAVEAYIIKHLSEDEDTQRLQRSEQVLKKFGLLPREFDLRKFLVALLREQVAGYYDPKTKTVNLLDWVDVEQQKPVLAHELTHALQDQSFDLEKWLKAGSTDLADSKKGPTPADIENDEISAARQAVVEGQAMAVLFDYILAPRGQTLLEAPQLFEAMKQGMLTGSPESPLFRDAPIYLREALTFPYRYGVDFVVELLRQGGKEKAFAGAFVNPPHSTRQIMEPKTYLSGERIPPMDLPDFKEIFKDYQRFDIGAVGEFDVSILIAQYAGADKSHHLYPHWRGGYYYAGRPNGHPEVALGLLYVSRWSNEEKAAEFAAIYAKALAKRSRRIRETGLTDEQPTDNLDALESLTGKHRWLTDEGLAVIDVKGDTVVVCHGLDLETTRQLHKALFPQAAAAAK